jgi:hypothetical protein
VSYTVAVDDDGAEIGLPDGAWVPGEGWYRHGPLFLHPGEHNPQTQTGDRNPPVKTGDQGWVLFGDTGWIGRIDNTDELFAGIKKSGMFHPGTAPRYRISATPAGLYLTPTDGQDPTIHLPWQETLPATGPITHPPAAKPVTQTGQDTNPTAAAGRSLREPGRPQVDIDGGINWFRASYSAFDANGKPVPLELQACVSVAVVTWTGGLAG